MHDVLSAALGLVLPVSCAGCGAPGAGVCAGCRAALAGGMRQMRQVRFGPDLIAWAGGSYGGVLRRVLLAYKDAGRTDCAAALAPLLGSALAAALRAAAGTEPARRIGLAVIPSTRHAFRQRGYRPVPRLLAPLGLTARPVLRVRRQTQDQARLGAAARRANRAASLTCRRLRAGSAWLLVDDIVTTGSTLREAARAVHAAGGRVVAAACVAATPRRLPARTRQAG